MIVINCDYSMSHFLMLISSNYNVHIDKLSIFEIKSFFSDLIFFYRNFRFLGLFTLRTNEIARICSVVQSLRRGGTTTKEGLGTRMVTHLYTLQTERFVT